MKKMWNYLGLYFRIKIKKEPIIFFRVDNESPKVFTLTHISNGILWYEEYDNL